MTDEQMDDFVSDVMQKNVQAICTLIESGISTMKVEFEHNGKKYVWYFSPQSEVIIMEVEK